MRKILFLLPVLMLFSCSKVSDDSVIIEQGNSKVGKDLSNTFNQALLKLKKTKIVSSSLPQALDAIITEDIVSDYGIEAKPVYIETRDALDIEINNQTELGVASEEAVIKLFDNIRPMNKILKKFI